MDVSSIQTDEEIKCLLFSALSQGQCGKGASRVDELFSIARRSYPGEEAPEVAFVFRRVLDLFQQVSWLGERRIPALIGAIWWREAALEYLYGRTREAKFKLYQFWHQRQICGDEALQKRNLVHAAFWTSKLTTFFPQRDLDASMMERCKSILDDACHCVAPDGEVVLTAAGALAGFASEFPQWQLPMQKIMPLLNKWDLGERTWAQIKGTIHELLNTMNA